MDTIAFSSAKHFALRKAVAYFVRENSLLGKYCDYDQLGAPISKLMCGWRGQDDMKQVDHDMLVSAFAVQGGEKNYCVPFWQIVGGEETDTEFEGYFIHVTNGDRITVNKKKMRVYKIGCTKGDGVLPETIRDKENHPLKDGSRMREFTLSKEELWDGMKEELQEFLRGRNNDDKKNQKNKKAKLQKVTEADNAKRSRPGTAKSADTTKSGESGTSTSSKKKGKRRKRQQTELKENIKEKKKELVELLEQLRKMKEYEAGDCPRVDATENRQQADEEAPQMTATAQTLSYVLNGKAGKFTKDLRVVTLGDLEEGLLHLDEDKQNSKAEATRKKTNLKPFNYGATSCWVPAGAAVIGKKDLTKLNQKAEIVKKLDSFFSSNQSAFSPQALRILTMFGLSNMGGSDEGMEMLIAGVLKALCHDIGFKVDSKKLGKVVPSRRTIARQEKNLMVDCLLHAVQEMTKDQIKYLFLIVDHGKRNGIEHFVKLVRWGGLDEKGNRVIKQLCLDMDMSGHTAKSAADAIKHSLKKLEKAGLNLDLVTVIPSGVTGDAGGGAAVQHIFPLLINCKVLGDAATIINCQMHGLNNCLSSALIAAFGDAGINHNNVVQAAYAYVKMMKKLKEDVGHDGLNDIHKCIMERMKTDKAWKDEAKWHNGKNFEETMTKWMAAIEEGDEEKLHVMLNENYKNVPDHVFSRWTSGE